MSLPPALLRTLDRLRPLLARLRRPTGREVLRGALGVVLAFVAYVLVLIPFTPGIGDIRKAKVEQPARVLSADGKELAVFKWANREWVGLADISPQVTAALIATEDHRFFDHHGIDFYRLGGAMLRTFSGDKQGGSTLTQQLARNLFPDEVGRARSINRKLKEAITALKIEAVYSKDEILETYLNTVPFLYNAWGIEMAARTYFDKPARRLDVLEAATLVGMLKGNSYYNPVINPERAVARRNTVLAQMVKRGKLDEGRLDALQKKPLRIDFERQLEAPGPAPHFAQQVRKWLIGWADRNDYNIYADGLVVRTTLDARLQAQATQAVIRRGNQLQGLADRAWAGRTGWAGSPALVSAFIRETKEFRAAVAAGQTPEEAEARLAADAAFIDALRRDKTRVQAGFVALDPAAAWTLLDVMRGVVDRGTGAAIRNQFGLTADLAGKTGTTQDNTDGWFILMHPQLVGGAWVGFNDNRITLRSDYWGQGARSALPIVGDAFHYALRNRLVDGKARFVSKETPGVFRRGWNWLAGLFASAEPEAPPPEPRRSRRAARPEAPPAEPEAPPVPVAPAPDWTPPVPPPDEPVPPRPAG